MVTKLVFIFYNTIVPKRLIDLRRLIACGWRSPMANFSDVITSKSAPLPFTAALREKRIRGSEFSLAEDCQRFRRLVEAAVGEHVMILNRFRVSFNREGGLELS